LHELQPYIKKPQGHEYDQFFFNSSGSGWLEMNGKKYELAEGSAFFIPAHTPHCYYPEGDVWDIRWMVPGGSGLQELYQKLHLEGGGVYLLEDESELDVILNRMRRKLIQNEESGNLFAAGYVYEFIFEFARQTSLKDKKRMKDGKYSFYMKELREYIGNHFMHPITLENLCEVIAVSPQHLCRIFKESVGMRPMEYVAQVRVEMAKSLLLYSGYPVQKIANMCGFQNVNYFCKIFKRSENMTPGEYRKSVV
jgi:AraC-like DNA-binding protein